MESGQVVDLFEQRRLTESELFDALANTEWKRESKTSLLQRVRWWLPCPWLVCELAVETRSYLYRIGKLIRLRTFPINCLGPAFGLTIPDAWWPVLEHMAAGWAYINFRILITGYPRLIWRSF